MNINYIDVTKEWVKNADSNSHNVKDLLFFLDEHGNKYKVDGKNVILDYSKKEKEIALFLESTFGGSLYMVPRVNKPEHIRTPDYIWNGEKWDLKCILGSNKRTIEDAIKKKSNQANNFIFDVTNSLLDIKELLRQIHKIYNSKSTDFVDKIIVIKANRLVLVYKRRDDRNPTGHDQSLCPHYTICS